jgi:hypothetical protein
MNLIDDAVCRAPTKTLTQQPKVRPDPRRHDCPPAHRSMWPSPTPGRPTDRLTALRAQYLRSDRYAQAFESCVVPKAQPLHHPVGEIDREPRSLGLGIVRNTRCRHIQAFLSHDLCEPSRVNDVPPTSPPEGTPPGGWRWPLMPRPNWTPPSGKQLLRAVAPRWSPLATWRTRLPKLPRWRPLASWSRRTKPSQALPAPLQSPQIDALPEGRSTAPNQRMFALRPGPSFWIGLSVLLLLGLLGAFSGGVGAALWFMSLVAFGTGLFGWIRRRRTLWFGTATGDGVAALLIGSLVVAPWSTSCGIQGGASLGRSYMARIWHASLSGHHIRLSEATPIEVQVLSRTLYECGSD